MDAKLREALHDQKVLDGLNEARTPEAAYDVVKDRIDLSLDEFNAEMAALLQEDVPEVEAEDVEE